MRGLMTPNARCACVFGTLFAILVPGCRERADKQNQRTPLVSPSGAFVLKMPVERIAEYHYWRLEIRDTACNLLYKDKEGFPARFNVYWCWDSIDIVWLYNSDDGKVYFYSPQKTTQRSPSSLGDPDLTCWSKHFWGFGRRNECGLPVAPPSSLYPEYVK